MRGDAAQVREQAQSVYSGELKLPPDLGDVVLVNVYRRYQDLIRGLIGEFVYGYLELTVNCEDPLLCHDATRRPSREKPDRELVYRRVNR